MSVIRKFRFILLVTSIASCSHSSKAEKQIKSYINFNLNDPTSYEPLKFSEPLNDSTKYYDDPKTKYLLDTIKAIQSSQKQISNRDTTIKAINQDEQTFGHLQDSYYLKMAQLDSL